MTWLRPFIREARILYYRWALSEMPPLHPDVPYVVHRLRSLLDERKAGVACPVATVREQG